ncbi:putative target of rapamycin (TOR) kinase 1 [Trypanosoma cruzi]|uniref:Putative target of rapamycin (TOR) kinase 1 n=1 Tax=Trypanosoma cruzi TaxID=5693 RepID=A0A2V2UJB6_TRYCR|nr:putative target of rapamycin (TOR) kinase 1 [Trypanosoma cruzi]
MRTGVTPRWEDGESGATQCTFLGVQFDHTHRAVSLSERLSGVYAPCRRSILQPSREWRLWASRFLYAAAILCTRLCDYYFSIKAVRRRLSALHQGIVLETSTANLLPSAVGFGERLRHIKNTIVGESSIPRKRHRPPSSRMRRSMDGEPFLFHNQSKLKLPEENGRGSLFSSCRRRHERYA